MQLVVCKLYFAVGSLDFAIHSLVVCSSKFAVFFFILRFVVRGVLLAVQIAIYCELLAKASCNWSPVVRAWTFTLVAVCHVFYFSFS